MVRTLAFLADWFSPGVRAGGPIRSCSNLAELLQDTNAVSVLTSCYDLGVTEPYKGVPLSSWTAWRGVQVFYAGSSLNRIRETTRVLWKLRLDRESSLYLNSMFSFAGTLFPLVIRKLWMCRFRTVLAPRGMLKSSALAHKSWKKRPLLALLRWTGLTRGVVFHATSEDEVAEIKATFPGSEIVQIPNVPACPVSNLTHSNKQLGAVRLLFVGRIHPIKNLLFLLQVLKNVRCSVSLEVVGPEEDQKYVTLCREAAASLPPNIRVEFLGAQTEDVIQSKLKETDAFVLPTEGENFGHAIFEAFAAGVPVIISDRTMWRNLTDRCAGWDLSLQNPVAFAQAIESIATMGPDEHQNWKFGALQVARDFLASADLKRKYEALFWPQSRDEAEQR